MTVEEYNISVDQFADNLYRFVLKNLKIEDRSQDIVQDTFEKLWVKKDNVDFNKVKSYLFTTAHHTMIDLIRKEKRITDIEPTKQLEGSHSEQYNDIREILDEAVSRMPDIQRTVVLLRDYEGYSYQEIAEITDLSEAQVKVYIYRGRIFLKNYIGSLEKVI